MKKRRLVSRLIAAALVICVVFSGHGVSLLAQEKANDKELEQQYVGEVKMFYGHNADHARELCEAEGFIFCPENLKEASSSKVQAYLGYKTTEDPGEAITDMTLLDMKNSHFEEMTYKEYLDKHVSSFADQAAQIMILVNEFRKKYEAKSPNALAAFDSLNMIYVDDLKSHTDAGNLMGTYLLNTADMAFFEKFIQRGNSQVLTCIVNLLGNAAADYEAEGGSWVDRSLDSDIIEKYRNADSAEKNQYNTWYKDPARDLIREIQTFADNYNTAVDLREKYGDTFGYEGVDENTTIDEIIETNPNCKIPEYVNAISTYDLLEKTGYPDEEHNLAEYFLELGSDENLGDHPEALYPLVASMSAAQRAVLRLCGLTVLAKSLYQIEDYEANRSQMIKDTQNRLKDMGYSDGKIWLWEGVDQTIYELKTAETSDAIEAERAGTEIINSTNAAAREAASDWTIALQIIDISLLALSGVFMIAQAIAGASLWTVGMACFMMSGWAMTLSMTGLAVGWAIAGALCCVCFVLSIIVLIASLAYLVYTILDMCGVFDEKPHTDYSKIPNILFHVRKNQDGNYRVRYDSVPSNADNETMEMIRLMRLFDGDKKKAQEELEREKEQLKRRETYSGMPQQPYPYNGINNYPGEDPYLPVLAAGFLNNLDYRTDAADLAAYQGTSDRWMALYVSKAPACGDPIRVVPGESIIRTQKEEYKAPAGCKAIPLIGGRYAADINSVAINEKTGTPLYMFLVKDPNAKEEPEETETETKGGGQYVTRVRLAHADKREDAVNSLKKAGFTDIYDVNLTPYSGYTFLAYQMGSRNGALTDLRASAAGSDPIVHGDASYAKAGLPENGTTPDGMALYATTSKAAGTPITKVTVETKRLPLGSGAEPVCLFAGGQAVDFKHKWSDNYEYSAAKYIETGFFTIDHHYVTARQDDPEEGGLYIYFWPEEQYKAPDKDSKAPYVSGFSYFMAASADTEDNRYGTHAQFMQDFAKANGFELVYDGDAPQKMMSDEAGRMCPIANWQDKEGGALGHDWTYDMYHFMVYGYAWNRSDGGTGAAGNMAEQTREGVRQTTMYFGVSYTYNPYRAITGIAGLISPYTETTKSLRFTGLPTPAGTLQLCNTSIQGNPVTQAGISYGYYGYTNMNSSIYTNSKAKQKSDLSWLSGGETEVMTHNLLTAGPTEGRAPLRRDDLKLVSKENPGQIAGYVPLCDLRTPGDYDHPMNLALDTTNMGSQYLYLYLKSDAGGRVTVDAEGNEVREEGNFNSYRKKHYVAAIFCGTGSTPEQAVINLYSKAKANWAGISQMFPDVSATPLVTEFDEILPVDLSDQTPWYQCYVRDVRPADPKDDEWVRGNDAANLRWGHDNTTTNYGTGYEQLMTPDKEDTADSVEHTRDYAYIGVVRTSYAEETARCTEKNKDGNDVERSRTIYPAYAMLKYYTNDNSPSERLNVAEVKCQLAGGPVKSAEGQYYLYYSTNSATASFSAPITEIDLSGEAFINGFNTSYSCRDSDRVDHVLPEYSKLRMRTDEFKYIHTKFDMEDLPYIERLYIGVGKNKKEAFADLIGTTNANAASGVNCNYNSFSDKWVAIGYRRTADPAAAVRDLFLYSGGNPPAEIKADCYKVTTTKSKGQTVKKITETQAAYKLIRHNLKVGSEVMSLNEGAGGRGLYLYYMGSANKYLYDRDEATEITPVRNIAFAYGDISPSHASADELAAVYGETLHGRKIFNLDAYRNPIWEYVLGTKASPDGYKTDGSGGIPMSLNFGQLPKAGNSKYHAGGDMRVMMFVDRGIGGTDTGSAQYTPRPNAALTDAGYYSATSRFGRLTQVK